jgi:hypothetical protein
MHEQKIRSIVKTSVAKFASNFASRHISEKDDPDGVINSKVHNVFVAALGDEVRFFSALSRSLDSSLGTMVEGMAIDIAKINFDVTQHVEGKIYDDQTKAISILLEKYKNANGRLKPEVDHVHDLASAGRGGSHTKRHDSDYVLRNRKTGEYYLIELKLGGDLDNKKARSEKEALLEQYCLLTNELGPKTKVSIFFATGYNRYGEGNPWTQGRVRQFFAEEELLISRDFWNFVCDDARGFQVVLDEYNSQSHVIKDALTEIRRIYL